MKRKIVRPPSPPFSSGKDSSVSLPRVENPFKHVLELSTLDVIQIAVMSVTIAPLRLLMVGLLLLIVWPFAAVGVAFRSKEDCQRPMTGWRCLLRPLVVLLCRGVFFMGGFHWIKVRGVRSGSKAAAVAAVAPHSSFFDSLALVAMDLTSVVAKAESRHIPIFGKIIQFTQPVLVSREDPDSRQNTIRQIHERAHSNGQWPQLFIFPEGTCGNRTCLISFKGGAFFPGMPVQPVCLRYHNRLDTMTWTWEGPGAFQCLWYTLCQFQNHLEIEYLPVYVPSDEEKKNPKLFANNVRQLMADHLGIPVTDHTYDDCRLMTKADELMLPMSAGLVEFQKLHDKLGLSYQHMDKLLDRFEELDKEKTGHVTLERFASYLQLPVTPTLEQIFTLYDRDQSGTIDFREYVISLTLATNPDDTERVLRQAFAMWDKNKTGYITREQLFTILNNTFDMQQEQVASLFTDIDTDCDGKINYEEFRSYVIEKPEYVKLFVTYHKNKSKNKNKVTPTTNGRANPDTSNCSNNSSSRCRNHKAPASASCLFESGPAMDTSLGRVSAKLKAV